MSADIEFQIPQGNQPQESPSFSYEEEGSDVASEAAQGENFEGIEFRAGEMVVTSRKVRELRKRWLQKQQANPDEEQRDAA